MKSPRQPFAWKVRGPRHISTGDLAVIVIAIVLVGLTLLIVTSRTGDLMVIVAAIVLTGLGLTLLFVTSR
jgi:hypothetical protein